MAWVACPDRNSILEVWSRVVTAWHRARASTVRALTASKGELLLRQTMNNYFTSSLQ